MTNNADLDFEKFSEWARRDTKEPLTQLIQKIEPRYADQAQISNLRALLPLHRVYNNEVKKLSSAEQIEIANASTSFSKLSAYFLTRIMHTGNPWQNQPDDNTLAMLKAGFSALPVLRDYLANRVQPEAAQALDIVIQEIGEFYPPALGPTSPPPASPPPDLDGGP